jgi:hypothetical protein
MSQWNIKPATLFILGGMVILMLLIVVLPDVDLPDTAFHRETAPVALHAQATAAPTVVMIAAVLQFPHAAETYRTSDQPGTLAINPRPNSRPILLRSIRR